MFEALALGLEQRPEQSGPIAALRTYLAYGHSIETKLRADAVQPQLAPRHVFNAGWLDVDKFPPQGESCDVAVYGMSFSRQLLEALHAQRPQLRIREFQGPGAPLSHSYAAYHMDVARRRAKVVLIPVLSDGVPYLQSMTHDTRESDHPQPMMWPRFELRDGRAVLTGDPVIRSAAELRRALVEDPALWERHLGSLAAHDDYYSRVLYASHWSERLASLRLVRRAIAHARAHDLRAQVVGRAGFVADSKAARLLHALLRQYVEDVRAHDEVPLVVLFDSPGEAGFLHALLRDTLERLHVEVVRSDQSCDARRAENFLADGHYVPACTEAIARRVGQALDRVTERALALGQGSTRREP